MILSRDCYFRFDRMKSTLYEYMKVRLEGKNKEKTEKNGPDV
jgi:hypothetical protein